MITIHHDPELGQRYAQLTPEAPTAFWLDADGELQHLDEVDEREREAVDNAAGICPIRPIMLEVVA